jgi:uncharacterized protein (TIGR00255 family)
MNSMTGFGRASLDSPSGRITVELSSVNNRFLELAVRTPRSLAPLEPQIRELLTEVVSRGKVTINVDVDVKKGAALTHIDKDTAKAIYRELESLRKSLKIKEEIEVSDILAFEEVFLAGSSEIDTEKIWPSIKKGIQQAAVRLVKMRQSEGAALARDMQARLKLMEKAIAKVEAATKNSVAVYAEKLARRVKELLTEPISDSRRLEEEIAVFADRTDIAEECTRFRSHIDQYRAALSQKDAAGRKLNFILQEMNREINTIGSKCADFSIAASVISLKEELEKLREQVQNIE